LCFYVLYLIVVHVIFNIRAVECLEILVSKMPYCVSTLNRDVIFSIFYSLTIVTAPALAGEQKNPD